MTLARSPPREPEACRRGPADSASSGLTEKEVLRKVVGKGGLAAYTGTSDVREVKALIAEGDEAARRAYEAMAYSVAREIGAMAAALSGKVDAILITGGVAYDNDFVALVQKRVQWIAPVLIYPGEDEMPALAEGAFRVLQGEELQKVYSSTSQEAIVHDHARYRFSSCGE